jgi:transposase
MVERVLSNGKRFYFSDFKAWLVEQARQPGASVSGLATRHGVNTNLLRHWMQLPHWSQMPAAPASPRLLPVEIAPTPMTCEAPAPAPPIELQIGDAVLRLRAPIDTQALRQVLQCLRDVQAETASS